MDGITDYAAPRSRGFEMTIANWAHACQLSLKLDADEKHIEAEGDPRVLDGGLSLCPCVMPSMPRLTTLTEVRTIVLLAPATTNLESQAGLLICILCTYLHVNLFPMVSIPCCDEWLIIDKVQPCTPTTPIPCVCSDKT